MWKITPEGMIIPLKVTPKADKNCILGWENDELKVKVAAVPDRGSANDELVAFIAKTLKISKSRITLISGATSRHKRILVSGADETHLKLLLQAISPR